MPPPQYNHNRFYQQPGNTATYYKVNARPPKAKCSSNQSLVDILFELKQKTNPASQFVHTIRKGMDAISKEKEPVTTHKQALGVKGIGPKLAHVMFPDGDSNMVEKPKPLKRPPSKKRKATTSNNNASSNASLASVASSSSFVVGMGESAADAGLAGIASAAAAPSSPADSIASSSASVLSYASRSTTMTGGGGGGCSSTAGNSTIQHGGGGAFVSKKQKTYEKAKEQSEQFWKSALAATTPASFAAAASSSSSCSSTDLIWKVILLIDNRERNYEHVQGKCIQAGIPTDVRPLPIGDMTWIAQGIKKGCDVNDPKSTVTEILLGTIIERKTLNDLESSIHGTRYAEQRIRMKDSGLFQLLLLVEGDIYPNSIQGRKRSEQETEFTRKCHTAIWETRLYMGFQAVQTKSIDETVALLKRLHRRILQRTFPEAFCQSELPAFAEPDASGSHRRRSTSLERQQRVSRSGIDEQRLRRRRRLKSIMDMTFDTLPKPPEGMDRYITYDELKAKIEYDRERAQNKVGNIHAAMLKQIATVQNKKVAAIQQVYPTPTCMYAAYHELGNNEKTKQELVMDLHTSDPGATVRKTTVGLTSSKHVYIAYGLCKSVCDKQQKNPYSALYHHDTKNNSALYHHDTKNNSNHSSTYTSFSQEPMASAAKAAPVRSTSTSDIKTKSQMTNGGTETFTTQAFDFELSPVKEEDSNSDDRTNTISSGVSRKPSPSDDCDSMKENDDFKYLQNLTSGYHKKKYASTVRSADVICVDLLSDNDETPRKLPAVRISRAGIRQDGTEARDHVNDSALSHTAAVASAEAKAVSFDEPWSCTMCTFLNSPSPFPLQQKTCEMCGNIDGLNGVKRTKAAAPSSSVPFTTRTINNTAPSRETKGLASDKDECNTSTSSSSINNDKLMAGKGVKVPTKITFERHGDDTSSDEDDRLVFGDQKIKSVGTGVTANTKATTTSGKGGVSTFKNDKPRSITLNHSHQPSKLTLTTTTTTTTAAASLDLDDDRSDSDHDDDFLSNMGLSQLSKSKSEVGTSGVITTARRTTTISTSKRTETTVAVVGTTNRWDDEENNRNTANTTDKVNIAPLPKRKRPAEVEVIEID